LRPQLRSSFNRNTFIGLRDKTIFSLFLDTGIRLGELCGIQLHDIDLKEGILTVNGKGRKSRFVPLGRDMKKLLWGYFKQRNRYVNQGDDTLFISRKGVGITPYGIQTLFRRVRKGLGWNKLNPHLMRHSFSVNYINNGSNTLGLSKILRHSSIEMTSRYVNLSTLNIKYQHNRFSVLDRI
jgi:site-specific recombinase XerD